MNMDTNSTDSNNSNSTNGTNNSQNPQNYPQPGTPEYDQMMKNYYGNNYDTGFRVGFGRRFGALLIDFLISSVIIIILLSIDGSIEKIMTGFKSMMQTGDQKEWQSLMAVVGLKNAVIGVIYSLPELFMGATLGKMILGIKIGNEDRTVATFGQLSQRFAFKHFNTIFSIILAIQTITILSWISGLYGLFIIVAFFFTLSETKQALYDKFTHTAVFFNDEIISESN